MGNLTETFEPFDFSGSNTITDEGIRNNFKKDMEPWQPLSELIWNGFDAGATEISVIIRENGVGGPESATILDNGNGIEFTKPLDNFRRFNDSLKKKSHSMHGSKGRGRLAFHKICNLAIWYTRSDGRDAVIRVESSHLRDIEGNTIPPEKQHALLAEKEKGTCVELFNFTRTFPPLESLINQLSLEIGWHLALNPSKALLVNGVRVKPPQHTKTQKTVPIDEAAFNIELLHWAQKPNSEKSYNYLLDSQGNVIYHMPSSLNYKPGYHTSLFISSQWFDGFSSSHTLSHELESLISSKTWKQVAKQISEFAQEHYKNFLITQADEQIEEFIKEGDFPDYSEFDSSYSEWRLNHTKNIIRAVIISDPKLLKKSTKRQRKIIIRLLDRISISSENDALLDVLESVLDLDAASMSKFSSQLKKTKLNNIIQTIETLQKRELTIQRISEIMRNHYKKILETPDLQKVIEANTWLFGNQYEVIGAEEDTFTRIAYNLRNTVPEINTIVESDVDDGATLEGANRQVDLFLVRKTKQFDSMNQPYFRCVIIEIKRPSIALSKRHLRQVDDYAEILSRDPDFSGANTKYEIILVGRKISDKDFAIRDKLRDLMDKNEPGLIGSGPIKRYVKTWRTIIEEFKISNDYLLSALQTQRDALENESREDLLRELQQKTV